MFGDVEVKFEIRLTSASVFTVEIMEDPRVKPFKRISPEWNVYEYVKTALLAVTLLPLRVFFFVVLLLFQYVLCKIGTVGLSNARDPSSGTLLPYARWRVIVLSMVPYITRVWMFLAFGIVWISDIDDTKKEVSYKTGTFPYPVPIVANHLGYLDIVVLAVRGGGCYVSKQSIGEAPILGTVVRAYQGILLREGRSVAGELKERMKSTHESHVNGKCTRCARCFRALTVFPEGTTTNGTALAKFRTGVFLAGVPVQPVCIRFPHRRFNMSWETIRLHEHLFRVFTQVYNVIEIRKMPVYVPNEEEQNDPYLYARNVEKVFSETMGLETTPANRKMKFAYHKLLLGKSSETQLEAELDKLLLEDAAPSGSAGGTHPNKFAVRLHVDRNGDDTHTSTATASSAEGTGLEKADADHVSQDNKDIVLEIQSSVNSNQGVPVANGDGDANVSSPAVSTPHAGDSPSKSPAEATAERASPSPSNCGESPLASSVEMEHSRSASSDASAALPSSPAGEPNKVTSVAIKILSGGDDADRRHHAYAPVSTTGGAETPSRSSTPECTDADAATPIVHSEAKCLDATEAV